MSTQDDKPLLASLVRGGDNQTEAEAITGYIFMAKDISNAYLVTTQDGDVLINTGFMDNAQRTKNLLEPKRTGPLRRIVITQAHADHFGGVPTLREQDTQIIAGDKFVQTWKFFDELGPYLGRRSAKLWANITKRSANPPVPPRVVPDVAVRDRYEFEQGGRKFEVLSTPGGEALCGVVVWMPKERAVFTGNLFGPVFLSMPFLVTTRGDKPRLVENYLSSLDLVRKLGAELLITGHGEPIRGADHIRKSLDKMYAAVSYIRDQTVAGMNGGKDVHTLMREIQLPADLKIGEFHGKVSWAVRSIWDEYSGWFHYEDSTTALYDVPRSSVNADLVELAGGAGRLAERAKQKVAQNKPLEALHLLDVALAVEPKHAAALNAKKDALQILLRESGGQNLSETMWLKSEITAADAALGTGG